MGQRQRLAIARALVRKPACLILDEATSALDNQTEDAICDVLDREVKEREMTVVIIIHRTSTIKNADAIIDMRKGRVVDQGSYEDFICQCRPDHMFSTLAVTSRPPHLSAEEVEEKVPQPSCAKLHLENLRVTSELVSNTKQLRFDAASNGSTVIEGDLEVSTPAEGPKADERCRSTLVGGVLSNRWLFVVGFVGAILAGAAFPTAGAMSEGAIKSLGDINFRPRTDTWSFWFLILAFVVLFLYL